MLILERFLSFLNYEEIDNHFYCVFISLSIGQENQISESDLVGYWTLERNVQENDFNVMVYRRCNFSQIGTVIRFKSDGKYSLTHKSGPRRCGNDIPPKNVNGYFSLDLELQNVKLNSYSAASRTSWDVIWIDENSFGVKKPKHSKTSNDES